MTGIEKVVEKLEHVPPLVRLRNEAQDRPGSIEATLRGSGAARTEQGAWTRSRTPLTPAPKRQRDLLRDRQP